MICSFSSQDAYSRQDAYCFQLLNYPSRMLIQDRTAIRDTRVCIIISHSSKNGLSRKELAVPASELGRDKSVCPYMFRRAGNELKILPMPQFIL